MPASVEGVYSRIYRCIQCIPPGKVATYGQIAKLINASGARQVGYALSSNPTGADIPWHRVINAKGEISPRSDGQGDSEQHVRLLAEGVIPNKHGRIKLGTYRWQPVFEDFLDDDTDDEDFWRDQAGIG